MKHISLIIGVLLTAKMSASAGILGDRIYIRESQGGPHGYAEKIERHVDGWFWDDDSLTCLNPGNAACAWTNPPNGSIIGWARDSVAAGNLSDTITWTHANGDISTLWWDGTDGNNYEASEELEYASGLE